jgi:hypothetical protein
VTVCAQSTNAAAQIDQTLNFLSLHLAPLMLVLHYRFKCIKTGSGSLHVAPLMLILHYRFKRIKTLSGRPDRKVDAMVRS